MFSIDDDIQFEKELLERFRKDHDKPDFWNQLTPAGVTILGQATAALHQRWLRLCQIGALVLVALLAALTIAVYGSTLNPGRLGAFAVSMLCWAAGFVYASARAGDQQYLLGLLQSLRSAPHACEHALELLKLEPVAAFRDQVVAQGRELTRGDYDCMQELAQAATRAQERNGERTWRALHGQPV